MRNRIISAILAVSMILSIGQTSFAFSTDYIMEPANNAEILFSENDNLKSTSKETNVSTDIENNISVAGETFSNEPILNYPIEENYLDDNQNDEYVKWKQGQVIGLDNEKSSIRLFSTNSIQENQISNDFLQLLIQNGTFSYYTTGGNPDSNTDDNQLLLYDGTSKAIINVDGSVYRYASYVSETNEDGSQIFSSSEYDDVKVEQVFSFVYNPYTKRNDTVEFKYVFTNNGETAKNVGTRIFFDIMLANNDCAPFKIPGYGDVVTESEFSKENMFQVWQTFDNLQNPTVVASGTLYNNISEKPDKIQFLNYGNGCDLVWDCSIDTDSYIDDTAVNVYFNPDTLNPGETKTVKTYYGLSALQSGQNINLGLSAFAPSELEKDNTSNSYFGNPFTINGFVENKTDEVLNNVTATLNLPSELTTVAEKTIALGSIESGDNKSIAWEISALPQYKNSNISYSVTLSADGVPNETTEFYIYLPRLMDDYGNFVTEESGVLSDNETTNGKFEIVEDVDYFKFSPSESGTYSFESISSISPAAELYDGEQLIGKNDTSGIDGNFYFMSELEEGKTYYLKIFPKNQEDVGNYTLCVNKLSDDVGNNYLSAKEITEKQENSGIINYPCDLDIYVFTPQKNGWYIADISGELDAFIELADQNGEILSDTAGNIEGNATLAYKLISGEQYFIKVCHKNHTDKDNAGTGNYNLTVSPDEIPPVVSFRTPSTDARVNKTINITATASDNVAVETVTVKYSYDQINWQVYSTKDWNATDNMLIFPIDTTTLNDGIVYIGAEAIDETGNISVQMPVNMYLVDNTPPEQLEINTAVSTVGANYISWKKTSALDAEGYIIYRSSDNGQTYRVLSDIMNINTLFYVDTNVVTGASYIYKITAYDTLAQESTPQTSNLITTNNDMQSGEAIKKITVVPDKTSFFVGESAKIDANTEYINGEIKNVTQMLKYTISDSSIISVDNNGNIKGLSAGTSIISVKVGENIIEIPFTVRSLAASITSNTIIGNGKEQITVKNYTLNGVVDITGSATYTVDIPEILTVNTNGEVQAHTTGQAIITVGYGNQTVKITVVVYAPPGKVSNTNVANKSENIAIGKVLTWESTSETESYNIYLWKEGQDKSEYPTARGLANTMYHPNLDYNTKYYWQIEAVNKYASTLSEIFEFSTIGLPDLECVSVSVPTEVFSESFLSLSWEIKNTGTQTTGDRQWYDYVYLSPDANFNFNTAVFLGKKENYSYLDVGESYRSEAAYAVPRGTIGKYYIFVFADCSYNLYELSDSNNIGKSNGIDIKLCPQPDLKVKKLDTSPSNVISGNQINVSWESENIGCEIPSEPFIGGWIDYIYLSTDETLSNDDTHLASVPVTVFSGADNLNSQTHIFYKNKQYSADKTITIPQNIFGDYYIIVVTDGSDAVYENENFNNTLAKKISVTLDPPADITPSEISIPDEMVSAGKYTVTWKDINEGSRDISNEFWTDRIYIDTNASIDMDTALLLKTVSGVRTGNINNAEIRMPDNIEGKYYLHIVSDYAHKIFEYNSYENNIASKAVTVVLRDLADLSATSVFAVGEARANEKIEINYEVVNIAYGATIENSWRDKVFISQKEFFDASARELTSMVHSENVAASAGYNHTVSVTIPEDMDGNYYLFVQADADNRVQESGDDTNNIAKSNAINILPRMASDLQITEAKSTGTNLEAGAVLPVSWTVKNNGEGIADAPWNDCVYLSTSPQTPYENAIRLGTLRNAKSLGQNESYKAEQNFILSGRLNGTYYIYVVTDINNSVYEKDNENNNFKMVDVITLEGETEVIRDSVSIIFTKQSDIDVLSVNVPEDAEAGKEMKVEWTIKNISEETTNNTSWTDGIYLVAENETDFVNGIKLGTVPHTGIMKQGDEYNGFANVKLPYHLSGKYKIIVVADENGRIIESNRENNMKLSNEIINVAAAKAVDFSISTDDISNQVTVGQPLSISWQVTNIGDADADGKWYDAVYLSYTETTYDFKLAEIQNPSKLLVNESYTSTTSVNLPSEITGPMFLIFKSNSHSNGVYELNDTNNTIVKAIELTEMTPVDLTVGNINIPSVAYPGNDIIVDWDVINLSAQQLNANMTDNVYISADENWDINDIPIGELTRNVSLAGNERSYESLTVAMPDYETLSKLTSTITDTMPGVQEGRYYVIVRTDVKNQVNENNKTNNRIASHSTLDASVPRIEIDGSENGVLYNLNEKYYRFSSNGGQSFNIDLTCDDTASINEVYVSYNKVPTAFDYDYKYAQPMTSDQKVDIPVSQKGEYYVYVKNVSVSEEGTEYDLSVSSVEYGVSDIYPKTSAQGKVTVKLSGALLEPNMTAVMSKGKVKVKAEEIYYFDSSNVYATFDMTYAPYGVYTLTVNCNGNISTLTDCFAVENCTLGELSIAMNAPSSYQLNSVGSATIRYKNTGNTDIDAPILVVSADNVMLKKAEDKNFSYEPMVVYGSNSSGPAGILPPGAEAAYNFAFKATSTGTAVYRIFSYEQIDDLGIEKTVLTEDSDFENVIINNLQTALGTSGKSYTNALSKIASYNSQLGYRTNNPDDLLLLLYQNITGAYTNSAISTMEDLSVNSGGTKIDFERQYFSGISERNTKSLFGLGWNTRFDGEAVCEDGIILITYPNGIRAFEQNSAGVYSEINGNATAKTANGEIEVTERNGNTTVYGTNRKIKSVVSVDGNALTLSYDGDKVTRIDYPKAYFTLQYNGDYVSKITGSNGKEVSYAYSGDLLTEVTTEIGSVTYEYDTASVGAKRNALTKIKYIDGTSMRFEYDGNGRLSKEQGNSGIGAAIYKYGIGGFVSITNALGNTNKLYYDQNGKIARMIDADGIATESSESEDGKSAEMTYSLFAKSKYLFNDYGDIVRYTNSMGYNVSIEYDEFGNAVSVIDEKGSRTQYSYKQNMLECITYSDGTTERYEYNAANHMTGYIDRSGNHITYSYDENDNLKSKQYSDGSSVVYAYDSNNNVSSVTDRTGTTSFVYDEMNNITKVTYGDGKTVVYEYNSVGKKTKVIDTENAGTNYCYDSVGRLESLTEDDGNIIVKYSYDKMSRVIKKQNGNGTYTVYEYTPGGNVKKLINYNPQGGVNSQLVYGYDRFGNVSSIATKDGTYYYEYDLLKQLVAATDTDGTVTRYSYDATGNRISEQTGSDVTYYNSNSLNQYTRVGSTNYSYDAAGNLITKTDFDGTTTYSYDVEGNLVNVTSPLGIWEYSYNAMGNRTSMTKDGELTTYLTDMSGLGNVIAEYSGSDVTKYIHGIGLAALKNNEGSFWYDFDMQGSTIGITDSLGQYVNKYSYSPEGRASVLSEAVKNPFKYSGQWGIMDDENGLNYIRARYYDASTGRFIALDSYGQNISTNGYKYANNNTVQFTDVDGEVFLTVAVIIGAGAVIGGSFSGFVSVCEGNSPFDPNTRKNFWVDVGIGAAGGAVDAGVGLVCPIAAPFASSLTTSLLDTGYDYSKENKSIDGDFFKKVGTDTLVGGTLGAILGKLADIICPTNVGKSGSTVADFLLSKKNYSLHTLLTGKLTSQWGANFVLQTAFNMFPQALSGLLKFYTGNGLFEFLMSIFGSLDPNDIIGPASYGDANWIAKDARLDYMIRCENDPEFATAPVQYLTITQKLDDNLDLRSFRLGSYGFGGKVFEVPENKALYQTRLDLVDEMGLYVDVWAGLDIVTGIATWTFTAIDPETGEKPVNPLVGFLPVNNKETGDGEGFATYSVLPKKDTMNGERIDAVSTIVFDNNAPIDTPEIFNTVDSINPVSEVTDISDISEKETVIEWTANDNEDGSGYAGADVYVSVNMTPFVLAMMVLSEKKAIYTTEAGKKYEFFVRARDNAGNYEAMKSEAEKELDNGFEMAKAEKPRAKNLLNSINNEIQMIELTTATAGADIFYTLDGETPTSESERYNGSINVSCDTVIKAIAVKQGMQESEVMTYLYEDTKKLIPTSGSSFEIDSEDGYLKGVPEKLNTSQIKLNFENQDIAIRRADGTLVENSEYIGTGSVIQLIAEDTVVDEKTVIVKGDVSGDGRININDIVRLFNHIQGTGTLNGAYREAALINADTRINVTDLVSLFNQVQN